MIFQENLLRSNKIFEEEYKSAFEKFISKGWYVLGEEVSLFEKEFSSFVGIKYCVGVVSGLDDLIISLECL